MDQSSFDRMARALGGEVSRRAGLGAVLGGLLGLGARDGDRGMEAAPGRRRGAGRPGTEGPCGNGSRKENTCTKDSECCTGICNLKPDRTNKDGKGRCRCRKRGGACTSNRNCCNGMTCSNAVCTGSSPTPPPPPNPCPGANVCAGGCAFSTVQAAIDAAAAGATIVIGPGTYTEDLAIGKNLTLQGCGGATVKDTGIGARTITVSNASVVELIDLIVDGTGTATVIGGGIDSDGQLTLSGSTKITNANSVNAGSGNGGGVYSHGSGNLVVMKDTASIDGCRSDYGGGVMSDDVGSLTMNDSAKIVNCTAEQNGGGVTSTGTFTMNGASEISGSSTVGNGGGLMVFRGTLAMNGTSAVKNNSAAGLGGGVYLVRSAATMNDSASVSGNSSTGGAGGVYLLKSIGTASSLTVTGSATITGNTTLGEGGGVYSYQLENTLTAPAGSITGNTPSNCAGTLTC